MGDPLSDLMGNPDAPFITQDDVNQLKNYVRGTGGTTMAESLVGLHVSHSNLKETKLFEIRLDKHVSSQLVYPDLNSS